MSLPYATRRTLDQLATTLRQRADAAQQTSWSGPDDHQPISYWTGRADGFMEAHGLVMAALTAGQPSLCIGDEIRFLYPEQATPQLLDPDAHYDVMRVWDGEVAVKRIVYRTWGEMRSAWHWAPLTAVERVSDGHRCPEGGA